MKENLSAPTYEKPTRLRFGVLGFVCALSMITYLDRVCFGTASSSIIAELGLTSEADLMWAYWGFTITYALFEIPTGWLGDVFGPRKTLIRIVLWWSAFTMLTGLVGLSVGGIVLGGIVTLIIVRMLFGVGEAGAYPNVTRALHNWFPFSERGSAQGTVWMAGRLMGGLTPMLWWFFVELLNLSWRSAFGIFGVIGLIWCVAFAGWFRNRPEENESVNDAERSLINAGRHDTEAAHKNVPWGRLLRSGNLWALCLMYFCAAYGWYFNITYLPRFLETQFDVDPKSWVGSIYKGGPLWMGAITCLMGGWLSDRFIRRTGNRKWGRRLFGMIGHTLCGVCYALCLVTPTAFTFFLAISLAAFWNDLTMGSAWATCQDIGRRHAAIVAGCMNTVGNLGGAAAALITGEILKQKLAAGAAALNVAENALSAAQKREILAPAYALNFLIFALVYGIAVLFWLRIDSTQPIMGEEATAQPTS